MIQRPLPPCWQQATSLVPLSCSSHDCRRWRRVWYHLQQGFFATAHRLWVQAQTDRWNITAEVREGNSPQPDFLITLKGSQCPTHYAFEFACLRERAALNTAVINKLRKVNKYSDDHCRCLVEGGGGSFHCWPVQPRSPLPRRCQLSLRAARNGQSFYEALLELFRGDLIPTSLN